MQGIYKITNNINNKVYIGESLNIERRWQEHKNDLNSSNHHSYKLQDDWNEYGEENFDFEIIEELKNNFRHSLNHLILLVYEDKYIKEYDSINSGYNIEYTLYEMLEGRKGIFNQNIIDKNHIEMLEKVIYNIQDHDGKYIKHEEFNAEYIRDILLDIDFETGGYIMLKKPLIHSLGLNETIIYCELINKWHWYQTNSNKQYEEFSCTINDLELSCGLQEGAQTTAIKRLSDLKLINMTVRGIPKKRYYKILNTSNPKNEEEHIIFKYINNGLKIIELKKQKNLIHAQQLKDNSEEIKLSLNKVNEDIKNLKS